MVQLRRERRRDFRHRVQVPLQIRQDGNDMVWGETLDLSTRGVCCSVNEHIPPLSTLTLTLGLSFSTRESVLLQCEGTVVRASHCGTSDCGRYIIAMYFLHLDLERAQLIKDYLLETGTRGETQHMPHRQDVIRGIPGGCRISYIPTDQQLLSKGLTQVDLLANVGELSNRVAQEIKNPLAGMAGTLQVLARDLGENHQSQELFQELFTQICRIDEMVDHLIQYSSPDPLSFRSMRIEDAINGVLSLLSNQIQEKGICLDICYGSNQPVFQGDERLLQQAILNILLYTLDAMREEETLSIHVWWKDKAPLCPQKECICASITGESDRLKVAIMGSGCNMDPKSMKRKFAPLFSSDRAKGLGLSISQRIVQEHNGHIYFGCDPGNGSAFMICLPTTHSVPGKG